MIKNLSECKKKFLGLAMTSIAITHAVGILWGSLHPEALGPLQASLPIYLYGQITGAASNVKFFSPNIGSQLDIQFRGLVDGKEKVSGGLLTGNREADLRIMKMTSFYSNPSLGKRERRSLVASWAGKVFSQHPSMDQVEIIVRLQNLPSMKEYRQGQRPTWQDLYKATFNRRDHSEVVL